MQILTLPQDYYRTQDLYGSNAAASYAFLGAGTNYLLNFYTGNVRAFLRFDDSNAVIEISLSVRHSKGGDTLYTIPTTQSSRFP